jgi:hypothetical protein
MDVNEIVKYLDKQASGKFLYDEEKSTVFVDPENWIVFATILKDDLKLKFDYLLCLSISFIIRRNT